MDLAGGETPLDYAVITERSAFPAGWVRFSKYLGGYVFNALSWGEATTGAVHADPKQAVPLWVGPHSLKKIHPIPENITGNMQAAAPAMLALLKQIHALMSHTDVSLPGLDLEHLERVLAIAEGRG